jgi:hypothetical protein
MRFGTLHRALCIGLLALYGQASLASEQTPPPAPQPSVKRDCADAKGATKKECEKVAEKIEAQTANPQPQPDDEAHSSADYVHHSSPAMRTPAEVAQDKAKAKAERKNQDAKPESPKPE